jgi:hypothetical protein
MDTILKVKLVSIRHPSTYILFFSMLPEHIYGRRMLSAGPGDSCLSAHPLPPGLLRKGTPWSRSFGSGRADYFTKFRQWPGLFYAYPIGGYIDDTLRIPWGCLEDVLRYKGVKTSPRHPHGKGNQT